MGWGWVGVQVFLFGAYGYALIATPSGAWGAWRWVGVPLLGLGAVIGLLAVLQHGRKLTPLPEPNPSLGLLQHGVYAQIRHPMYVGVILMAFGGAITLQKVWGLVVATALFLFFYLKAREEERRLLRCYPEYADYMQRTGRFLPRRHR
ncbi:MAG: isoprenylcysteine carboxylmethyltransferase family protein [Armatimonadota bacterium]|nr:isoprenylcysteine carboxylmethyltransferase family protein [Armatimonadota bacterium]